MGCIVSALIETIFAHASYSGSRESISKHRCMLSENFEKLRGGQRGHAERHR
jgi:hypothetical protein